MAGRDEGRARGPRRAVVLEPGRVRTLQGTPFGWLAAELHRGGWLRLLTPQSTAVYAFLCLVADRSGVSYYRRDRMGLELGLEDREVHLALARLEALDLVAYRPFRRNAVDGYRQVLTLPGRAPASALPLELAARVPDLSLPESVSRGHASGRGKP